MSIEIPNILWLDDPRSTGNPLLGGKFSSLATSVAAGYAVPPGFGITTQAYREFVKSAGIEDEIRRVRKIAREVEPSQLKLETAALVDTIMTAPLPKALHDQIARAYQKLEERTGIIDVPVAVRSSGESEDLAGASFAGQYETYLWVCDIENVIRYTRQCWAGMFSDTVLTYRHEGQQVAAMSDFSICVGIQQMVQARAAGVMFTLDPITGDRSKIVIESCWGLGEGVVKGDVTPTQFKVDKVTMQLLKREQHTQTHEYRFDPESGEVGFFEVEPERQDAICLPDEVVLELAKFAKQVEKDRGAAQDIEWAVDDKHQLHVLQVRPETVWSSKRAQPIMRMKSPVDYVLKRMTGGQSLVESGRE
ncbi:MAG: PEP/pyruvate-binding domain-containing protein [Alcaligenes sp.]